jgi:hypothetical protein
MIINGFVYAGKIMELPELINPTSMVMDNTRVYIADGPNVLIYSLEKSKLIKKIGREGDGPGEFRVASNLPITHYHVSYVSFCRLSPFPTSFFPSMDLILIIISNLGAFITAHYSAVNG